ncbi:uncharacterized protein LOC126846209 [Adelges cooleyi]|uniref:uncharacterized protein LOC126846209 n=1 Tax=Adelges cooleyi TaxID=133065 RepID=UPI0021803D35|nr:uncharacterized protein LOC126846209 [Adelges cooleyi]
MNATNYLKIVFTFLSMYLQADAKYNLKVGDIVGVNLPNTTSTSTTQKPKRKYDLVRFDGVSPYGDQHIDKYITHYASDYNKKVAKYFGEHSTPVKSKDLISDPNYAAINDGKRKLFVGDIVFVKVTSNMTQLKYDVVEKREFTASRRLKGENRVNNLGGATSLIKSV